MADYRRRKDRERKIEKRASLGRKSQNQGENGENSQQKEKSVVQVCKTKQKNTEILRKTLFSL